MPNPKTANSLEISRTDLSMIIEGLEELKTKGFETKMMTGLLSAMLFNKKDMTPEQLAAHEAQEAQQKQKESEEKAAQEEKNRGINLLKAKLTVALESNGKPLFNLS